MLKLDIGGGAYPRGNGFLNVDILPCADIRHDINQTPWPFDDQSVDEVYSSHCVEHVSSFVGFIREVARICKIGASAELRCPDSMSDMAMCPGHTHVISVNCVRHASEIFLESHWKDSRRMLSLVGISAIPDDYWFPMARSSRLFNGWTNEEIMMWIPRTRHENRFCFIVTETPQHIFEGRG